MEDIWNSQAYYLPDNENEGNEVLPHPGGCLAIKAGLRWSPAWRWGGSKNLYQGEEEKGWQLEC